MALKLLILSLLACSTAAFGQVVPSESQIREWTEKDPPKGYTITNRDRFVDYKHEGKVVLRVIRRTIVLGTASGENLSTEPAPEHHLLEFVADGNVIASVGLDKGDAPVFEVTSGEGVYFSSGYASGTPNRRFFYVCIPKLDYFEYVEASGADVTFPFRSADAYDTAKRGFMKIAAKGYVHPLGKERLLDKEKER